MLCSIPILRRCFATGTCGQGVCFCRHLVCTQFKCQALISRTASIWNACRQAFRLSVCTSGITCSRAACGLRALRVGCLCDFGTLTDEAIRRRYLCTVRGLSVVSHFGQALREELRTCGYAAKDILGMTQAGKSLPPSVWTRLHAGHKVERHVMHSTMPK